MFGMQCSAPIYLSSVAKGGLVAEDGENTFVRAAHRARVPYIAPTVSSSTLEDIFGAREPGQSLVYQFYLLGPDPDLDLTLTQHSVFTYESTQGMARSLSLSFALTLTDTSLSPTLHQPERYVTPTFTPLLSNPIPNPIPKPTPIHIAIRILNPIAILILIPIPIPIHNMCLNAP